MAKKKTLEEVLRADLTVAGQSALIDLLTEAGGRQEEIDEARRIINLVRWLSAPLPDGRGTEIELNGGLPVLHHRVKAFLRGTPSSVRPQMMMNDQPWQRSVVSCLLRRGGGEAKAGAAAKRMLARARNQIEQIHWDDYQNRLRSVLAALALPRSQEMTR